MYDLCDILVYHLLFVTHINRWVARVAPTSEPVIIKRSMGSDNAKCYYTEYRVTTFSLCVDKTLAVISTVLALAFIHTFDFSMGHGPRLPMTFHTRD